MSKAFDTFVYASPIVIVCVLFVTYLGAPDFYLDYILEEDKREERIVEFLTFLSAFIAGLILAYSTWNFWENGNWWAAGVVGLVSVATLVFAGEEIGWGQTFLNWKTPTWWEANYAASTDLHSTRLPANEMANLFLFVIFLLLPLAWKFHSFLRLPVDLEPAIAEGPVIFNILFAAVYRELKGVYLWFTQVGYGDPFFKNYVWGLNEQKEMLIGIAMLWYALYRLPRLR